MDIFRWKKVVSISDRYIHRKLTMDITFHQLIFSMTILLMNFVSSEIRQKY